LNKILL